MLNDEIRAMKFGISSSGFLYSQASLGCILDRYYDMPGFWLFDSVIMNNLELFYLEGDHVAIKYFRQIKNQGQTNEP